MPLPRPLRGIVTPLLTPLSDPDTVDAAALDRLIDHVIGGGVHGIFVGGTSGEGPAFSIPVQCQIMARSAARINGRVPLLVGITHAARADAIALASHASRAGADAVVTAGPLYFPVTQTELAGYCRALADACSVPLFLYNIPSHAHVHFEIDTVLGLSEHPNIAGIKDSSGELQYLHQLSRLLAPREGFSVLIGPEELTADAVMLGVHGGINGGSNLFPRLYVDLYEAAARGDLPAVHGLNDRVKEIARRLYTPTYLQGVKCAAAELGLCRNILAPPGAPLAGMEAEAVRQAVRELSRQ